MQQPVWKQVKVEGKSLKMERKQREGPTGKRGKRSFREVVD